MSMKRRGPRDWSPRPDEPDLEDLKEAQDVWNEIKIEITGILARVEDVDHYIYKARHWMKGGSEFSKQDAAEFLTAVGSVAERLKELIREADDSIEVTKEIAKWLFNEKKKEQKR